MLPDERIEASPRNLMFRWPFSVARNAKRSSMTDVDPGTRVLRPTNCSECAGASRTKRANAS